MLRLLKGCVCGGGGGGGGVSAAGSGSAGACGGRGVADEIVGMVFNLSQLQACMQTHSINFV